MDQNLINLNTDKLEDITNESFTDLSDIDSTGLTDFTYNALYFDGTKFTLNSITYGIIPDAPQSVFDLPLTTPPDNQLDVAINIGDGAEPQLGFAPLKTINTESLIGITGGENNITLPINLSEQGDVVLTTPGLNDLLAYDGTNWVNVDRAHASIIKAYAKNGTAGLIAKGTPVYQTGTVGNTIIVAPADASDPTKMPAVGVLGVDLLAEEEGELLVLGEIQGVNTSLFTAGDQVYVAPGGGYTNIKPTDPAHEVQFLGIVIRVDANNGSGFVTGTMSPDLIKYNGTGSFYGWNGSSWEVLATELNELSDVILNSPVNNQVLKYDGIEWINTDLKTINGNSLLGAGNLIITGGEGGGTGSLIAYNSDGSQDDIVLQAYSTLNQITVAQELIFDNSSVVSMETTASYGWRDLFAPIDPRSTQSGPSWALFRDGIYLYAFNATQTREVFATFHLDHDYALGTKVYPHVHFTVNTTSSGVVRWGIEYTVAKGHQQVTGSTYGATTTVYVEHTINGATDQYKHFVSEVPEVDAIPATLLEPDSVILVRLFRDGAHPNDTYPDNVFGIQMDCHYQANTWATINKSPNFYGA